MVHEDAQSPIEPADCSRLSEGALTAAAAAMPPAGLDDYEFGGKLAAQLGASMSDERDNEPRNKAALAEAETRMAAAARPQDIDAKLAEMSHEDRVQATLDCLGRKNNQKEILYDLLAYCAEERTEAQAEAFLEAHKQFADGHHSASKYLFFLRRTGGLEEREYDSDGVLVTEQMRDELRELGASEWELADLTVEWRYATTAAGLEAIERFDPAVRTRDLFAHQKESRHASYRRLLEFCCEPRTLAEVVAFMDGDPGLEVDPHTGVMQMQPSAYIGLLEQAGALTWENGWKTTEGGMEALEQIEAG